MKQLLFLLGVLTTTTLLGQITIEYNDYFKFNNQYFRSATNIGLENVDLTSSAGPNQIWDFTWLDNTFTDTLRIIKADLTPFYSEFPEADFGITSNLSNYFYEKISPDGVSILGRVNFDAFNSVSTVYRYNSNGAAFQFPINYNSNYNFELDYRVQFPAFFPGSDSIRQYNNSYFEIEADAWGQLQLPIGNFDVLRVKQTAYITDTVYVYDFPPGWGEPNIVRDSTVTWLFYAKEIGYRLLSFNQRLNGSSKNVNWLKGFSITGEEKIKDNDFKIYPQPASEFIQVESKDEGSYSILSITGQIISSGKVLQGLNTIQLNQFDAGIYFLAIKNEHNQNIYSHKVVVSGNSSY